MDEKSSQALQLNSTVNRRFLLCELEAPNGEFEVELASVSEDTLVRFISAKLGMSVKRHRNERVHKPVILDQMGLSFLTTYFFCLEKLGHPTLYTFDLL